jgi:hypothetical protein
MDHTGADPLVWRRAARRAADFLCRRQLPSGEINEAVEPSRGPTATLFRAARGCDVWHTVNAVLALSAVGETSEAACRYVSSKALEGGGLPPSSGGPELCSETTAAAALAIPALRLTSLAALRRHALPHGRWICFFGLRLHDYDFYVSGPSVTGWALTALGGEDSLAEAGRRYLVETLGPHGIWNAHDLFYCTPFYPAHIAAAWLPDRRAVLRYTLGTVGPTGGWGFGDPPDAQPSTLPTAWALLTLLACDPTLATARGVAIRAAQWLVDAQTEDGSLPIDPCPGRVWYSGSVYATSVAITALARIADCIMKSP